MRGAQVAWSTQRNIVRPFGLWGDRYEVTERGLLYQRLAWLCALSAVVGVMVGDVYPRLFFGFWAIYLVLGLVAGRLVMLVPRHGRRLPR